MGRFCHQLLIVLLLLLVPGLSARSCAIQQTLSGWNCHSDTGGVAAAQGHDAGAAEFITDLGLGEGHEGSCLCDAPRPTSEQAKVSLFLTGFLPAEILGILPPAIAPPRGAVVTTSGNAPSDPQRNTPLLI
jgi:hypothetical protein